MDSRDSNLFLDELQSKFPNLQYRDIVDCGAGIGRVTRHLLLPRCINSVTLVEQSPRLLRSAPAYILPVTELAPEKRIHYIEQGLQVSIFSIVFALLSLYTRLILRIINLPLRATI
jgi:hypothetical protein